MASLRCYGLLESDPDRLAEAVAHYRTVGPAVELPAALEDLAVVLAERGHENNARAALNEAVGLYEDMQARWDIRRAEGRLRQHGIKRSVRGRRGRRATSGWEALTPTELKVAALSVNRDLDDDPGGEPLGAVSRGNGQWHGPGTLPERCPHRHSPASCVARPGRPGFTAWS